MKNIFTSNAFTSTIGVAFFLVMFFGNRNHSNFFSPGLFLRKIIFHMIVFSKFRAAKILVEWEKRSLKSMATLGLRSETFSFCAPTRCDFSFCERSGVRVIPRAFRHIFVLQNSSHLNAPRRSDMLLCPGAHFISRGFHHMCCALELNSSQERSRKMRKCSDLKFCSSDLWQRLPRCYCFSITDPKETERSGKRRNPTVWRQSRHFQNGGVARELESF